MNGLKICICSNVWSILIFQFIAMHRETLAAHRCNTSCCFKFSFTVFTLGESKFFLPKLYQDPDESRACGMAGAAGRSPPYHLQPVLCPGPR